MQAEYDGRQIVGIDLHPRRSVIVRMAEDGERLGSVRIDNDPVGLNATEPRRPIGWSGARPDPR